MQAVDSISESTGPAESGIKLFGTDVFDSVRISGVSFELFCTPDSFTDKAIA